MAFQSAVRFIGEKLVDILQLMTKFDGYQNLIWGWLAIISCIMCPIIILLVIKDVGNTLKIETREEAAKKILEGK